MFILHTESLLLGIALCADFVCPYLWLFSPGLNQFPVILPTLLITALCYYLLSFSAVVLCICEKNYEDEDMVPAPRRL